MNKAMQLKDRIKNLAAKNHILLDLHVSGCLRNPCRYSIRQKVSIYLCPIVLHNHFFPIQQQDILPAFCESLHVLCKTRSGT